MILDLLLLFTIRGFPVHVIVFALLRPAGLKDLPDALALAIEIEELAAVYSRILAMGDPVILDDEEMVRVVEKFSSYGVQG